MGKQLIVSINITLLVYAVYIFSLSRKYLHMLQLNSYMNRRFWNWYRQNIYSEIQLSILAGLLIVSLFVHKPIIFCGAWCIIIAFAILMRKKTSEKKKFVVTARVRRLYITLCILMIVIIAVANIIAASMSTKYMALQIFYFILAVLAGFKIPLFILANTINLPIEKSINNWYVNDAKRILNASKNLIKIGITGSYGKTSVKYFLTRILSEKYNVLMTPESYNTLMGVVRTIREQLKPSHEVFVAEMGAKQKGDIKEICDVVHPKYSILTAIGPCHLDTFKSIKNVENTKFEIIEALPQNGVGFLNYDNEIIRKRKVKGNIVTYGINDSLLDCYASDIKISNKGTSFYMNSRKYGPIALNTKLLGRHNVLNITAACAVAIELGVEPESIRYAVSELASVPHRMELKPAPHGGITIIDDAFNSNPEGAREALNVLGNFDSPMRILITPGMVELGEKEYECNFELGKYAAKNCDYAILVGIKRSVPLKEGLIAEGFNINNIAVVKNLKEALEKMKQIAVPDSVVLFENDLPDNYEEQ